MTQVPVTIIGGYLGAGKTTLVNALLRKSEGRRVAVLVNDFGEINIDADLIQAADDDIMRLTGGCACCRIGDDLGSALERAIATESYDHVLVEASGVGQPARLAQTVALVPRARLWGSVVVCDATNIRRRIRDHYVGELVQRQVAEAALLILNKCDAVDANELQICKDDLAGWNQHATFVEASYGNLGWGLIKQVSYLGGGTHSPAAITGFRSTVLRGDRPIAAEDLREQIALSRPVRVKGYATLNNAQQMLVELTGDTWVWPSPEQIIVAHELVAIFMEQDAN